MLDNMKTRRRGKERKEGVEERIGGALERFWEAVPLSLRKTGFPLLHRRFAAAVSLCVRYGRTT